MKALVGAFNQEKALVGAFSVYSVIVQPVVEPMEHYTALVSRPPPSPGHLSGKRTRLCWSGLAPASSRLAVTSTAATASMEARPHTHTRGVKMRRMLKGGM